MDEWKQNKACTTGRKTGAQNLCVCDLCGSNHLLLSQLTTAIVRRGSHSQPSVFRGEAKNRHQAELLEESNLHAAKGNHYCSEGLSEAEFCRVKSQVKVLSFNPFIVTRVRSSLSLRIAIFQFLKCISKLSFKTAFFNFPP